MAAVLLMVLFHHMLAFFHSWERWREEAATIRDLEALQKHNCFPFIFTEPLIGTLYNPEPKGSPSRHNQALVKKRPT